MTQFREERLIQLYSQNGSQVKLVCGELNAKNAFGAYTGFKPFFYVVSRIDSDYVGEKWPYRAIYKEGDVIFKDGNNSVYYQYCEREPGERTDEELWINE